MNLTDINELKRLLSRHGFTFSKALGQNFITDSSVCPKMAELSGVGEKDGVIEVGPGVGVLTVELSKRAKNVVSIELDTRLIPVLAKTLDGCLNVQVINADVLKTDLKKLIEENFSGQKVFVCANLPYYITSPVIMYILESRLPIESLTLMVQKEAGERLCARVGSRDSGAITVAVNYFAEAQLLFPVMRQSFTPAPNVDSVVIKLDIRKKPPIDVKSEKFFFEVIKAAFSQRRKTAANGLSSGLSLGKDKVLAAIEAAGLSPTVRAEALSMEQLGKLSDILYEMR